MDKKIQAKARVQFTVEISLGQPWSDEETVKVIYKRASDEARNKLSSAISLISDKTIIIGEAKIIGVFTESN